MLRERVSIDFSLLQQLGLEMSFFFLNVVNLKRMVMNLIETNTWIGGLLVMFVRLKCDIFFYPIANIALRIISDLMLINSLAASSG